MEWGKIYKAMTIITELEPINQALEKYQGGRAKIWAFKLTLNRIFLRITSSSLETELYLLAAGCDHIKGPFSWNNINLSVIRETDKSNSQVISRAIDKKAGFDLVALGGILLIRGSEKEFIDYFDKL